jgi:hypothetical protein
MKELKVYQILSFFHLKSQFQECVYGGRLSLSGLQLMELIFYGRILGFIHLESENSFLTFGQCCKIMKENEIQAIMIQCL